jgi:hypothetical protein
VVELLRRNTCHTGRARPVSHYATADHGAIVVPNLLSVPNAVDRSVTVDEAVYVNVTVPVTLSVPGGSAIVIRFQLAQCASSRRSVLIWNGTIATTAIGRDADTEVRRFS